MISGEGTEPVELLNAMAYGRSDHNVQSKRSFCFARRTNGLAYKDWTDGQQIPHGFGRASSPTLRDLSRPDHWRSDSCLSRLVGHCHCTPNHCLVICRFLSALASATFRCLSAAPPQLDSFVILQYFGHTFLHSLRVPRTVLALCQDTLPAAREAD